MAVKKTTSKTTRKAAEKPVEKVVLEELKKKTDQTKPAEEKKAPAVPEAEEKPVEEIAWGTNLYIQSVLGGTISIDEVLARVHAAAPDAREVYIKPEENKAYWVGETSRGYVVLWD